MKKQYPYSNNKQFLSKLDNLQVREQWVKITLLEYNSEKPIESIEGKINSGTLNKTGDSAVRRTCSLSCTVDGYTYKPDDIRATYSISKKIYLELGITNSTDDYLDDKIIWFPQGVFFITSISISSSVGGAVSLNLQFKDKMAQLDGTFGGTLPTTVQFDTVSTVEKGIIYTDKALVYDIIMEAVNHFGNEDISNIIIDDIPKKIKRIIKWMGEESVWIYPIIGNNNEVSYNICFASELDEQATAHMPPTYNQEIIKPKEYKTNEDIGYIYENFVYDEELTFNAGAKVTDVLNKIKNWLGNYEYFYDEYGQFHFQEIKNYLNNSQSTEIWDKAIETDDFDYLYDSTYGKAVYIFDDNTNLISITNTPVYENIKNDFVVEGTNTTDNIKTTCRYHLVIDDKPAINIEGYSNILIYEDPFTGNTTITKPVIMHPTQVNGQWVWSLPESAADGRIYGLLDEPQTLIFEEITKNMDDFATKYNDIVNRENTLISENDAPDNPVSTTIPQLWADINPDGISASELRVLRIAQCKTYISDLQTKEQQLNTLIGQYAQIINNYTVQIEVTVRHNMNPSGIVSLRNVAQSRMDNFKAQQDTCNERLTILYAILVALGVTDFNIPKTYYKMITTKSARVTSFWYYNTDIDQDNYGWNELSWYQYYHDYIAATEYYPDGIGSMTYIDFNDIDWMQISIDENSILSMNRYADWYQDYYIDYAIENKLSYIAANDSNTYIANNWRVELLLQGLEAEENSIDPGPYYAELKANWPIVYDFRNNRLVSSGIDYMDYFVGKTGVIFGDNYSFGNYNDLNADSNKTRFRTSQDSAEVEDYILKYENSNYHYFFDMIDSSSPTWGEYSVKNIGRRMNINTKDGVNCVFASKIPDYAFVNTTGLTQAERANIYAELSNIAEEIIQITDNYYINFATGGSQRSAYEQIKYDLQQYTSYQNTISITAVPCFYLEPNVRVRLNEHTTNTFGDYIIKSISIPLGGNSMSLSLSKAMEKI